MHFTTLTLLLWCALSIEEKIKPTRPAVAPEPGIDVYVGGVPASMSSYTSLYGCIRGLKIGKKVFQLQKAARNNDGKSMDSVGIIVQYMMFNISEKKFSQLCCKMIGRNS